MCRLGILFPVEGRHSRHVGYLQPLPLVGPDVPSCPLTSLAYGPALSVGQNFHQRGLPCSGPAEEGYVVGGWLVVLVAENRLNLPELVLKAGYQFLQLVNEVVGRSFTSHTPPCGGDLRHRASGLPDSLQGLFQVPVGRLSSLACSRRTFSQCPFDPLIQGLPSPLALNQCAFPENPPPISE